MSKSKYLQRVYGFLFYSFVFFLPFQIDILVFTQEIYYSGFFNPYLSHFLYFSDLLLLGALFFLSIFLVFEKKKRKFVVGDKYLFYSLVAFGLSFVVSMLFSSNVVNSLMYFVRYLEFFAVYLLIANKLINLKTLITVFVASIGFQAFIGVFQYILQESLGLRLIGEPMVSSTALGVAKVDVFSAKYLRVYGTFPHPNIFAGYLLFAIFLLPFAWFNSKNAGRRFLLLVLLFPALVFTFSRSAYLAFVLVLFINLVFLKGKIMGAKILKFMTTMALIAFLFGFAQIFVARIVMVDPSSILERLRYFEIAWDMFKAHPFGVGAGNFTHLMQTFDPVRIEPWLLQPVHNIFVLVLAELGVFGLLSYIAVFASYFRMFIKRTGLKFKSVRFLLLSLLIVVLTVGMFDHYFVSLSQGQALFWLMLWISFL